MASNQGKRSLGRKAAAAVMSGLLVFGSTPILPIAQALATEGGSVVVEETTPTEPQEENVEIVESQTQSTEQSSANNAIMLNGQATQQSGDSVAKVGDTSYNNLAAALNAANAGDTIEIQGDIVLNNIFMIDKSITINGNGFKLENSANRIIRLSNHPPA